MTGINVCVGDVSVVVWGDDLVELDINELTFARHIAYGRLFEAGDSNDDFTYRFVSRAVSR